MFALKKLDCRGRWEESKRERGGGERQTGREQERERERGGRKDKREGERDKERWG